MGDTLTLLLLLGLVYVSESSPPSTYDYSNIKDVIYEQPINFMGSKKNPHNKEEIMEDVHSRPDAEDTWAPYDFDKLDAILNGQHEDIAGQNRVKRSPKNAPFSNLDGEMYRERSYHYLHPEPIRDRVPGYTTSTRKPAILPEYMNPGVVFRLRMSDAILRIKQRMYDDPENHIEGDIIYTNLIKKVVMDEITKFHNLLLMYKTDKSVKEHLGECGGRIYKFVTYMTIKVHIYCLFDALWIDGNPYVIGDEYSVTPVEVPPMLQCDAAECNSVVFVDSFTKNHQGH